MKYVSGRIVRGIYTWLGLERGGGRANRKWCARAGRLAVQQVVEGGGCIKLRVRVGLPLCVGGLSPLFEFMKHNPTTDILHSPAYEDGTDSEFRNVGN